MIDLSKHVCMYILMWASCTLIWTQNNISGFFSNSVMVVHYNCIILCTLIKRCTTGISSIIFSILWIHWLGTTVSLGLEQLMCTCVLVGLMVSMLLSKLSSMFIPRRYCGLLYLLNPAVMLRFPVICTVLCYLYSVLMVHIFLCDLCTTLLLVFHGNGTYFPVFFAHLLMLFSCKIQPASENAWIPWCWILSCILVTLPSGSWILFLVDCCRSVLLHSSLVSWCDYMWLLLVFMAAQSLVCGIYTNFICY